MDFENMNPLVILAMSLAMHMAWLGLIMLVQQIEIWLGRLPDRVDAIGSYFFQDYDCHKHGYLIGMSLLTVWLPEAIQRECQDSACDVSGIATFCLLAGLAITAVFTFIKVSRFAPSWDHDGSFLTWTGIVHMIYVALLIASGFFLATVAALEEDPFIMAMPILGFFVWLASFRDDVRAGRFIQVKV